MLSSRSVRALRSATSSSTPSTALLAASRPFSTSGPTSQAERSKAPSLANIGPDGAAKFAARQSEFRDQLASLQRRKEQEESASRLSASSQAKSSSASSSPPSSAHAVIDGIDSALSSLSFTNAEDARAREQAAAGPDGTGAGKKGGPLSSLFYGTEAGREMDKEIERSFSQVLARGKYVHSIVFHDVKPDKVDEYAELVGQWYPKIASMKENKVNLVGSWRTEVGDCDTFVHIWEYQRYTGYHGSLHATHHLPGYAAYEAKLKTLIRSKNTSLMQEFSFWPTTPPRQLGGLFELRSYTLHPGNLLEWETHWRRGLKARREVMEGVGAWFVQIGDLNTVHHLWQFANLEERKINREQSWSIEGWGETVHKTVPLIQTMKSRVLIPMPWSPVA